MSLSEIFMLPGVSGGPRLVISDASESFDFEANSHSFFVNSNLTWSWSADVAWITSDEDTPQTGSQTFSYSVTENISTQRTGTITFTAGDITRTHTVTQGPYPILTIDDAAHTFDSDADSLTFNVTSNTDWTWFASEDWVTSSEAVFQNGNQAFTYSVTANTGAERTATITFVDVQAGVVTAVHSITQSAEATPLLLDTYTGAVGFSLRKIRTAYTGDCIRVRRASDDAEQDIGFSGNDLDTAAIETFCSGTTGYVTTWYDQVGSNDAVQATASRQPIIYESGAVVVNEHDLPAIRFLDDDGAVIEHILSFPAWFTASTAYIAYSSVYSMGAAGNFPAVLSSSPTPDGSLWVYHDGSTREVRVAAFRGTTIVGDGSVLSLDTTTVRYDYSDRTNVETFLDKTSAADISISDSDTDISVPSTCSIGNRLQGVYRQDFKISEVVGFLVDQTADNLDIRTDQYDYWTDSIPTPPAPLTLSIDSASATFNEDAQSGSFGVTSNTDWTWASSAAWLTSAESSPQNGNQTFSYSVSENTGSERVATITLSITGTSVIHTVTQDAAPVPPVDPDIEDFTEYDYVADMVASMDSAKGAGQVWYAQGYRYVELDSGATDQHLTTAAGVKLRALQDGSGAVTTEQLGWLPAVVQETAANAQLPKLDIDSVLTVTDFYNCDNYRANLPNGINIFGAFRGYSGFKSGTQTGAHRQRIFGGQCSLRRVKYECDQLEDASAAIRVSANRFVIDDVLFEHKANVAIQLDACNWSYVHNCEFWDAHLNLYLVGGENIRCDDNYYSADWTDINFGEGIKTSGSETALQSLRVFNNYFDRLRRDGVDLTGGGKKIRIVNNVFHLNGVGRNPANVGVPKQGIDIKIVGSLAIKSFDCSDNIFWGATSLTTQSALDLDTAENRWTLGLNGLCYSRNIFDIKNYFGVIRGNGPEVELFGFSTNDRLLQVATRPFAGAMRSTVITANSSASSGVNPFCQNVVWMDYANHIILPVSGSAVSRLDWNANFIGPKITGHSTRLKSQYSWWTRLHKDNTYLQITLSMSMYGPGWFLQAWSDGSDADRALGRGIMISSSFASEFSSLLAHSTGDNGKINDCYIVGNIIRPNQIVDDPDTDIRTGLWIRQNTSDGANARTGAGTTSPVIEQNVGVS